MDLEEIRKKRLMELQKQAMAQQNSEGVSEEELMKMEMEMQKKKILKQILTEEARSRLSRVKLVKPELAQQVELQLIQLAQTGRLQIPVSDAQLKLLLDRLHEMSKSKKKEIKFIRK